MPTATSPAHPHNGPDEPSEVLSEAKLAHSRANGPRATGVAHRATIPDSRQGEPVTPGDGFVVSLPSGGEPQDGIFPVPVTFALGGHRLHGTLLSTDGRTCIVRDSSGWKWCLDVDAVGRCA